MIESYILKMFANLILSWVEIFPQKLLLLLFILFMQYYSNYSYNKN